MMACVRLLGLALLGASAAASGGDVADVQDPLTIARALKEAGFHSVLEVPEDLLSESGAPLELAVRNDVTPVVMMHGMGDFAENPMGMVPLRKIIAQESGAYVHSVALCTDKTQFAGCDAEDQSNGFRMVMDDEVDQFARVVQADPQLAGGFNAVGFSQGNLVIRGYIHRYNNPPVKNFVSLHGVLMGVNGIPQCPMKVPGLGMICRGIDELVSHFGVYSGYVQDHLAQANYYRDAANLEEYRANGHYLPYINNEVKGHENSTYAENFKSLEKLVLVMAEEDTMIKPKESEHFGFFEDGSNTKIVEMRDAPWYKEDWFGLRSLDEAKKVDVYSTPGNHLGFTQEFLKKMVKQYFAPQLGADLVV